MALSTHEVPQTYTEFIQLAVQRRALTRDLIHLPNFHSWRTWSSDRVVHCHPTQFRMPGLTTLQATITTPKQHVEGLIGIAVGTQTEVIAAQLIPIPKLYSGEDPDSEAVLNAQLSLPQNFMDTDLRVYLPGADLINCLTGPAADTLLRESIRALGEEGVADWKGFLRSRYRHIPETPKKVIRSALEGVSSKMATKPRW